MQLTRLAAAALFALAPSVTFAAVTETDFSAKTTGDLVDLCAADPKEPMGTAALNFCHGFAQGAVDAVRRRAEELKKFCFPSNPPPRGVIMTEFANWARALPAHRAEPAIDGLFHFLGERFPCK